MTIHTTAIEGEYVEPSRGLVPWQQIDVTRLAKLMWPSRQQAHVVRPMTVMARQTVLLHRRMLPEERAPLFGVTGVAKLIG